MNGLSAKLAEKAKIRDLHREQGRPITHLFYPTKRYVAVVFDFSWDDCNTQKKLETMVVEKLGARGGGGGGQQDALWSK